MSQSHMTITTNNMLDLEKQKKLERKLENLWSMILQTAMTFDWEEDGQEVW